MDVQPVNSAQSSNYQKSPQEIRYEKIRKQIEYYFGDINLYKDRFLKIYHRQEGRWIPIDVLMTFKHLRQITTVRNEVIIAVKYRSQLVEVSPDGDYIRRCLNQREGNHETVLADYKRRSVFVGNLPYRSTYDEIKDDYLGLYGDIPSFVMRRDGETQRFRGSIFATFNTVELAQQFLANPVANIFGGRFLTRMMQLDYEKIHPPRPVPPPQDLVPDVYVQGPHFFFPPPEEDVHLFGDNADGGFFHEHGDGGFDSDVLYSDDEYEY